MSREVSAKLSRLSADPIWQVTIPRALPASSTYRNPTDSAILAVRGSWTLGESTIPGSCISCRNTVVIRFGELFGEFTSPCARARGVAALAAKPLKAPADSFFPKSRRDSPLIPPLGHGRGHVQSLACHFA